MSYGFKIFLGNVRPFHVTSRTMFAEAGFRSPSFDSLAEFFLAADDDALHDRPYPEVIDLLPGFRYPEGKVP